jgi:hypothetical protein
LRLPWFALDELHTIGIGSVVDLTNMSVPDIKAQLNLQKSVYQDTFKCAPKFIAIDPLMTLTADIVNAIDSVGLQLFAYAIDMLADTLCGASPALVSSAAEKITGTLHAMNSTGTNFNGIFKLSTQCSESSQLFDATYNALVLYKAKNVPIDQCLAMGPRCGGKCHLIFYILLLPHHFGWSLLITYF